MDKMNKWRNSTQKKVQQVEFTARDLINTDISKASEQEFKTIIISILSGLDKSIQET